MFESISKAITAVKETVGEMRQEAQAAAVTTEALDKGVVKILNTAQEEVSKFKEIMKGLIPSAAAEEQQQTPPVPTVKLGLNASNERPVFDNYRANPNPTHFRDTYGKGRGVESDTTVTASSAH